MMRASIVLCVFSLALPASSPGWASGGRYLTWVDDNGGVHNTFVDGQFDRQQRQARQRIGQSDQARVLNKADNATQWPGNSSGGESKRRYYTWIDANGNVQNSFYAGAQVAASAPTTSCPTASTPPNTSMPRPSRARVSFAARTAVPTTPGWTRRAACTTRRSRPRSARRASSGRPRLRRRSPSPRAGRSSSSNVRRRCPGWMAPASRAMR